MAKEVKTTPPFELVAGDYILGDFIGEREDERNDGRGRAFTSRALIFGRKGKQTRAYRGGSLREAEFSEGEPYLLVYGGQKGSFRLWKVWALERSELDARCLPVKLSGRDLVDVVGRFEDDDEMAF